MNNVNPIADLWVNARDTPRCFVFGCFTLCIVWSSSIAARHAHAADGGHVTGHSTGPAHVNSVSPPLAEKPAADNAPTLTRAMSQAPPDAGAANRSRLPLPTANRSEDRATSRSIQGAESPWSSLAGRIPMGKSAAALVVVIGVFLIAMWTMRRGLPGAAGRLPTEIVQVVGRAALTHKQSIHLVRIGGKLIVVSITPSGTETLTEITDPEEVTNILAACQHDSSASSTAAFRQLFDQIGREPARGYLGRDDKTATPSYTRAA